MNSLQADTNKDFLCYIDTGKYNDCKTLKVAEINLSFVNEGKNIKKNINYEIEVVNDDNLGEINQEVEEAE